MSDDHDDVLALFARCEAAPMPETLEARVLRAATVTPIIDESRSPLERAFDAHRDDAWSFVLAAVGDADVARDALEDALLRVHARLEAGAEVDLAVVLGCAREATGAVLPLLRKAGHGSHPLAGLDDDARGLLLLRACGLSCEELLRAGALPKDATVAEAEEALRAAAAALAAELPLPAHEGAPEQARAIVRARLALLAPAQRAQVDAHAGECAACGVLRERVDAALDVPPRVCPDAADVLRRVAERVEKDRAHRAAVDSVAARVSIACSYCHAPMLRRESVFCAACLAPHHDDCFRDHGRCSAPGCQAREVVRPGGDARKRRWPWLMLAGFGSLTVAAMTLAGIAIAGRQQIDAELAANEVERARVEAMQAELEQRKQNRDQTILELTKRWEEERAQKVMLQDQNLEIARRFDEEKRRLQEEIARGEAARVTDEAKLAALWRDLQTMAREKNKAPEELLAEARRTAEDDLDARIEAMFRDIQRAAEEREVEALVQKFALLRELMKEAEGRPVHREKLARWQSRLSDFGEVSLSIQLQVFISEGNACLQAMAQALRDDDFARAEAEFAKVERLVAEMQAQEREVFHRNAEALLLRARSLVERARRLKTIAELKLDVTAVDADAGTCVVNGHACKQGDVVPGTEVTVVKVVAGTVLFQLGDTQFVRELASPR